MPSVSCPSCGEKGTIPEQLAGKKIKCQKCGRSFQAVPATAELPVLAESGPKFPAIEVDATAPDTWLPPAVAATVEPDHESDHEAKGFTASPPAPPPVEAPRRQYKVLTQRDRFFEGKFDLTRLEEALNHYAGQGWVVRAMSTPHVTGFSGGPREEIVVLLER